MRRLTFIFAVLIVALLPLAAQAGGGHHGYEKCEEGYTWNSHKKKCKPDDTTTTSMIPSSSTTTTQIETTTTTVPSGSSSTTAPSSTTTTLPAETTTAPTTTLVLRSIEPYTFCEDGATWIGAEFVGFTEVQYFLEDPLGTPDGTIGDSEAVRFGVLRSDTFFTFIGDGRFEYQVTLNVPATDCGETTTTDPGIAEETTLSVPETLPFTGAEDRNLIALAGLLLGAGSLLVLVGWSSLTGDFRG